MAADLIAIFVTVVIAAAVVAVIGYVAVFGGSGWEKSKQKEDDDEEEENVRSSAKKSSRSRQLLNGEVAKKKEKSRVSASALSAAAQFAHRWLVTTLKGHSGRVVGLDFSSNGRHLVSCAEDRTLMLWSVKDFEQRNHKSVRGNVDLDQAGQIFFAPDCKTILVTLVGANKLAFYQLAKKDVGSAASSSLKIEPVDNVQFPQKHIRDITHAGIACNAKFVLSCSGSDSNFVVWSLRGELLKEMDTKQSRINCAKVSPCGRFVATSGFTADVKVFEVAFDRMDNFQGVNRAFELKGHNSGVFCFDFNQDSTRMVTVCKDGRWRLFDTDIRYKQGQEACQLCAGPFDCPPNPADMPLVCLSPSNNSFALAIGRSLSLFPLTPPEKHNDLVAEEVIGNVHQESITALKFSSDGRYLASAGDKHLRIFANVAGKKADVAKLKRQAAQPRGDAHKRRLLEQIDELENELANWEEKSE